MKINNQYLNIKNEFYFFIDDFQLTTDTINNSHFSSTATFLKFSCFISLFDQPSFFVKLKQLEEKVKHAHTHAMKNELKT
jgi:hypothetical protein